MLSRAELRRVAAAFGVSEGQVRRDHLISHLLHGIAQLTGGLPPETQPVFFGGTALARTWLRGGRLSEDIDLYAVNRTGLIAVLESDRGLLWQLRREFPGCRWDPALSNVSGTSAAEVHAGELTVRVQLLSAEHGYEMWPTEQREIDRRYKDLTGFGMRTPTLPAFVAMKTGAWCDRHAARDLWDLARLAEQGALTSEAAHLIKARQGVSVAPWMFDRAPDAASWAAALDAQTAAAGSPDEALLIVRRAWVDSGQLPTASQEQESP